MARIAVDPARVAEQAARASYGRLVALLAAPGRDIHRAEDALGDAFVAALTTWPQRGVPENPEAWLLTAARNRQRDLMKSSAAKGVELDDVYTVLDEIDLESIPDKRLELLFVCAHPAIDPAVRTPLMLQTVLGFEAADIARAFAMPASTMAQRLVRAKRRIREAGIPFVIPTLADLPARLPAVLEAVYGAYAIDWRPVAGTTLRDSLSSEALYLALTLAELHPDGETLGLAALISLSTSRRVHDGFVPLGEQDPADWDAALIAQGESLLARAHALGGTGRFQLEAAIQSWHCSRSTDSAALVALHRALIEVAPTLGAHVALASLLDPDAGLAHLDALGAAADRFQPAWATRAHLLQAAGRDADAAYAKAISLTTDGEVRGYLERKRRDAARSPS